MPGQPTANEARMAWPAWWCRDRRSVRRRRSWLRCEGRSPLRLAVPAIEWTIGSSCPDAIDHVMRAGRERPLLRRFLAASFPLPLSASSSASASSRLPVRATPTVHAPAFSPSGNHDLGVVHLPAGPGWPDAELKEHRYIISGVGRPSAVSPAQMRQSGSYPCAAATGRMRSMMSSV